jgi:hypothetical protein
VAIAPSAAYCHLAANGLTVLTHSPGSYLPALLRVPRDLIVQRAPSEFDKYSDRELVEMLRDEVCSLLDSDGSKED